MHNINKYQKEIAATCDATCNCCSGLSSFNKSHNKDFNMKSNDNNKKDTFILQGLDCADCAAKLEKKLNSLKGVEVASINFGASTLKVEHTIDVSKIIKKVEEAGYGISLRGEAQQQNNRAFFSIRNYKLLHTAISGVFLLLGIVSAFLNFENITLPFYIAAILAGGYYPARTGFYSLKNGFTFDMNVLMTIAVVGAAAIGEWLEAATVIFLFSLGNTLESYTMEKTRQSIRSLMNLAPKEATVRRDDSEVLLPVEDIQLGDIVVIKPGEKIPVDGEIITGISSINQAPITGESIPVRKEKGDKVFAGTINQNGYLEVKTLKLVKDTTLAKIIEMVEEAQEQKASSQRFVDVFAKYYTPAVIGLAVVIAAVPPLFFNGHFNEWFYRALALLVVSCPCALVISTPVSIVSAIGNAAKNGVLIKGGAYLEQAGNVGAVAFDKTGTLTQGEPEVKDVIALGANDEQEVVKIAAVVEAGSEHHLAEAILKKAKEYQIEYAPCNDFVSITGKGVKGNIEGIDYYVASPRYFLEELKVQNSQLQKEVEKLQRQGKTTVVVGNREKVLGIIAIADSVRENSKKTIQKLKKAGIATIMLTGDNRKTAAAIASELELNDFEAELLPEDKVNSIKELERKYGNVVMVGDGINDAPALATATVGIAMGGAGTDTALETADIVLMADDPGKLPFTMNLSKKALKIIKQNIAFALVIKLLAVALVFPGVLNLWLAILADTGASLAVIANGMRLLGGIRD